MKQHINDIYRRSIFIDQDQKLDFDFMRIAKKQTSFTFDKRFLDPTFKPIHDTPFKEIRFLPLPLDYQEAIDNQTVSYDSILNKIISTYKKILRKIKSDEKYLLCASAGSDTRILCALLAQLRDEEGYKWDNIIFHCLGTPHL